MSILPLANKPFKPSNQDLGEKPWKYRGYHQFTSFVASDDTFFVLRRFGKLSARILLSLQDEISELESKLESLESLFAHPNTPDTHNGTFRGEISQDRKRYISSINKKLRDYNELVLQYAQLRSRPEIREIDVSSVKNWFRSYPTAIHPPETRLWKTKNKIDDENAVYTSDTRIELFARMINTFLGLLMLVVPLWIFAFVDGPVKRLGIITVCLLLFLSLVTFTTTAREYEALAATAAYAAVLVVFLQVTS
ncbi:hypothetical protein HBH56_153240 [Parastagonospora nodorum]|nr:hypothetical protein HBH56_153240 [Parastagonospora nodorum]KAH3926546.1 hypothetical protein HBH54_164440 [Parastagonospora nodorum]KAH3940357.1 hypothetical protein HBH53_217380 [Parastagonospora nodorum]KAH3996900.1 hypothetical protein HBI10_152490 [Parastagonospora nodorum]KAH4012501.1 hypothetical protein HBI13_187180 [Parastagonospora nodorum]